MGNLIKLCKNVHQLRAQLLQLYRCLVVSDKQNIHIGEVFKIYRIWYY